MSQRITRTFLSHLCDRINTITNSPASPYKDGKPQAGAYLIDEARNGLTHGGYALMQINRKGSAEDVFRSGPVAAKDIANLMAAYIKGIETGKGLK